MRERIIKGTVCVDLVATAEIVTQFTPIEFQGNHSVSAEHDKKSRIRGLN